MTHRSPSSKLYAPIVWIACAALAAAQSPSKAAAERQAAFIRALAKPPLGFVSLAESEVEELLKNARQGESFKAASELAIEVSLIGAKLLRDREKQRTYYRQTLEQLDEFITRYRSDPAGLNARITLTDACLEYARFSLDEIQIARLEGQSTHAAEEAAVGALRRGEDACQDAMKELAERAKSDPRRDIEHDVVWLRKGILLREHARLSARDRGVLAEQARKTLEQLVLKRGEETALGLKAFFEYAQVDEVVGKLEDAARTYREVIGSVAKALAGKELELPTGVAELLVVMMAEAYDRLTTVLFEQGKTADVLRAVADYSEQMKRLGAQQDEQFGHMVLLTGARARAESGAVEDVGAALAVVQQINEAHVDDVVGARAKQLLKDILAVRSNLVSGKLLYEVALGDFHAKRFEQAIKGLKRAIACMTAQEQLDHGMAAWSVLGRAYGLQRRYLESVYALKKGLELHGRKDAEETTNAVALLEKAIKLLRQTTNRDPFYQPLERSVTQLIGRLDSAKSEGDLAWRGAMQLMEQRQWAEAAEAFAQVPAGTLYHELAMARAVEAQKRAGQIDAARAGIRAFRTHLAGEEAKLPPDRADLATLREQANAEIDFQEADLLYGEATGVWNNGKKDPTKLPEVIARLNDFEEKHGKSGQYLMVRVTDILARSYADLGELDKAEEEYHNLIRRNPADAAIPRLATALFNAYWALVQARTVEYDGVASKTPTSELLPGLRKKRDAARAAAVVLGVDYAERAPSPQYEVLWTALQMADELKDWKAVETIAERAIARFDDDERVKPKVDRFVRPLLGRMLLEREPHEFRQAYDVLAVAEQAGDAAKRPNYPAKRLLCLALGGWKDIDPRDGSVITVTGLGRFAEAYEKYYTEYRPYALSPQRGVTDYSLDWYRFHWEAYWFAFNAANEDSKYAGYARTLYAKARSIDDWQALKQLGPQGQDLFRFFASTPPPR